MVFRGHSSTPSVSCLKNLSKINRCRTCQALTSRAHGLDVVVTGKLTVSQSPDESRLVAVKMLKDDSLHEVREDFMREVKVMASFDHDNILRLIGVVPIGGRWRSTPMYFT